MTKEDEAEVQRLIKKCGRYRIDGYADETWKPIQQKDIEVLPLVLQVCSNNYYVLPRLWNVGF